MAKAKKTKKALKKAKRPRRDPNEAAFDVVQQIIRRTETGTEAAKKR